MSAQAGQKLSNVRAGVASVHTWEIPEVFGKTNARERALLVRIMKMRRCDRRRNFGDADPVSVGDLMKACGQEVSDEIASLNINVDC